MDIRPIQDKIRKGEYRFSDHAVKKMIQRLINRSEVEEDNYFMKCPFCGGRVEKKRATFTCKHRGRFLLVENVPAKVCVRCGEKTYSPEVTDKLLRFAREECKPVKTLEVPVFDFAEKG